MEDVVAQTLNSLFGPQTVLGPAAIGSKVTNPEVLRQLFESDNRAFKQVESLRPPFIVGRRGSGKTTLLRSGSTSASYFAVELNTKKLLDMAARSISQMREQGVLILEDQAADVWDYIFANALIRQIVASRFEDLDQEERSILQQYTAHELFPTREPEDFALLALTKLLQQAQSPEQALAGAPFETIVFEAEVNGVAFLLALEAIKTVILKLELEAWVLIDSVEAFMMAEGIQASDHLLALPLAGLFQSISQLDEDPNPAFRARLCFPAEVYHTFVDFSLNPMRDFSRQVMLHWSAGELVHIAAQRLRTYLRLVGAEDRVLLAQGTSSASRRRADSAQLHAVLPEWIKNGIGKKERILPYLIRHTQLSPRHLLALINRILAPTAASDPLLSRPASNDEVVSGVKQAESQMVDEILGAYRRSHPLAREILGLILPNLPTTFTEADLELAHKEQGKGIISNYDDFRRMAIELGCIGEVIKTTEELHEVRFEYHLPHKLNIPVGPNVLLAVHPIFGQVIGSRGTKGQALEGQIPVYPQAWEIGDDSADYRDSY